ncbi:hypothetical protein BAE44_0000785 [Dichanthelium oligosanthes]|uniref:F-box domain-containing protein n=1 Tax=Dichanthelium oligosanthes TaxID=888268 RepID=A0A1E5WLA7_9POAL|nr:hypothetical protein BAE44_0000785 [Dichanthelium oligosanthes]
MPSSSRRRSEKPHSPAPIPPEARDWAALPRDILFDVFLRLGPCSEIMRGAEFACTDWRRVAVDEPALWRRADLTVVQTRHASRLAMARPAVDWSAGQCEAFSGTLDADSLLYLVERTPLKSLHLPDTEVADEVFNVALKILQDLEISTAYYYYEAANLFESVCKACPHLKKLRLTFPEDPDSEFDSDGNMEIRDGGMCAISIMRE